VRQGAAARTLKRTHATAVNPPSHPPAAAAAAAATTTTAATATAAAAAAADTTTADGAAPSPPTPSLPPPYHRHHHYQPPPPLRTLRFSTLQPLSIATTASTTTSTASPSVASVLPSFSPSRFPPSTTGAAGRYRCHRYSTPSLPSSSSAFELGHPLLRGSPCFMREHVRTMRACMHVS